MPLNESVVDDVANTNFKAVAGRTALLSNNAAELGNLALANAVSLQQQMNAVAMAATGKMVELIASLDPSEALGNAVVGQEASKVAGNTPPVTP